MKFPNQYHLLTLFTLLYGILISLDILQEVPVSWLSGAIKSAVVVLVFFVYFKVQHKKEQQ